MPFPKAKSHELASYSCERYSAPHRLAEPSQQAPITQRTL